MSLDTATLNSLAELAKHSGISKAEVVRRAVRKMKEDAENEAKRPSPLQALEWLQGGAGLGVAEGADFKREIEVERNAKRWWWES